jgi:hypothetical protein
MVRPDFGMNSRSQRSSAHFRRSVSCIVVDRSESGREIPVAAVTAADRSKKAGRGWLEVTTFAFLEVGGCQRCSAIADRVASSDTTREVRMYAVVARSTIEDFEQARKFLREEGIPRLSQMPDFISVIG